MRLPRQVRVNFLGLLEKDWKTYWAKRCEYSNKDEDKCPKARNDINHQGSSQEIRQLKRQRDQMKIKGKIYVYIIEQILRTEKYELKNMNFKIDR